MKKTFFFILVKIKLIFTRTVLPLVRIFGTRKWSFNLALNFSFLYGLIQLGLVV